MISADKTNKKDTVTLTMEDLYELIQTKMDKAYWGFLLPLLIFVCFTVTTSLLNNIDQKLTTKIDSEIKALDMKFTAKFEIVEAKFKVVDYRLQVIETRLTNVENKLTTIDSKLDRLLAR